ncbi:Ran binding protein zinc finger-like protein [Dioscorea alata]|uniref:Ran binding protein zinc finger-like protein n=1 Tax=Dioscorea alata TaxID=55571 RepID=A0ACB7WFS7_DIOAL|nr:Ran binding protein zinc finger-like protein [Dioscorea alata]
MSGKNNRVERNSSTTKGSMERVGDWYCISCGSRVHNFAWRSACINCGSLRDSSLMLDAPMRPAWRSGDWICNKPGCNEHNYARRTECIRCNTPRE